MADEKKRIINETTDTAVASSGDFVIVDSQTEGTRKIDLGAALAGKVDTVSGKGLSTNDYTTEEKTKLAGIATGATNVTVDNTLSNSGQAADAKATGDEITQLKEDLTAEETARANAVTAEATAREAADDAINTALETKANVNGYYQEMTAGDAEQLVSTVFVEDSVPYQFRTSGGSADIGDREYDEIVGGSIAWNQLVYNGNFANEDGWDRIACSKAVSNNEITATATIAYGAAENVLLVSTTQRTVVGHKYLFSCDLYVPSTNTTMTKAKVGLRGTTLTDTSKIDEWETITKISTVSTANNILVIASGSANAVGDVFKARRACVFDLTAMFGTTIADYIYSLEQATAGAGVAWFKKFFPKDYYAYDAGTMMHVSGLSSHDMVGFNAWDETVVNNVFIDDANGRETAGNGCKSSDYIPVVGGQSYYIKSDMHTGAWGAWYDSEKNYISGINQYRAQDSEALHVKTAPINARYMRLTVFYVNYLGSVTCVNLHWDGERDGEYEPYEKHSYPLDDSLTLRGILKLDANNNLYYDGDIYSADGTVTRKYGIVDLGTLDWFAASAGGGTRPSTSTISGMLKNTSNFRISNNYNCYGDYTSYSNGTVPKIGNTTDALYVGDPALANKSAAEVKAAMSGVMLVYELATPTTEEAEPYNEVQIVDDFGTEEYVTTSLVPVGHYTKYPANLRSAIERVMEQVPEAPSANGTYTLKATRTASGVTYAWTAE